MSVYEHTKTHTTYMYVGMYTNIYHNMIPFYMNFNKYRSMISYIPSSVLNIIRQNYGLLKNIFLYCWIFAMNIYLLLIHVLSQGFLCKYFWERAPRKNSGRKQNRKEKAAKPECPHSNPMGSFGAWIATQSKPSLDVRIPALCMPRGSALGWKPLLVVYINSWAR